MKKTTPVKQYENGKLVAVYESYAITEYEGYDASHVRKVAKGLRKSHFGSTFKTVPTKEASAIKKIAGADFGRITAQTLAKKGITLK